MAQTTGSLNVGLICHDVSNTAATVIDHLNALTRDSRHNVVKISLTGYSLLPDIDLDIFDVLVIHYTVIAKDRVSIPPRERARITACGGGRR